MLQVLAEQLFALLHSLENELDDVSLENELDDVLGVLHMLWNNETVKTLVMLHYQIPPYCSNPSVNLLSYCCCFSSSL